MNVLWSARLALGAVLISPNVVIILCAVDGTVIDVTKRMITIGSGTDLTHTGWVGGYLRLLC